MFHFGLTEELFWRLTPAQFSSLSERFDERRQIQDVHVAQIMCLIANVNRGPKSKAFKVQDFLPASIAEKRTPKSTKTLHAMFKAIVAPRVRDDRQRDNG